MGYATSYTIQDSGVKIADIVKDGKWVLVYAGDSVSDPANGRGTLEDCIWLATHRIHSAGEKGMVRDYLNAISTDRRPELGEVGYQQAEWESW